MATDRLKFIMSSMVAACFLFSMGNKPSAYVFFVVLSIVSRLLLAVHIALNGNTS